jgi:eukaryotic-like serine/threonine-protein kinase
MTDTRSPVFNKRYELISQVGRGGTAQVYLARDVVLGRSVALKVLYAELSTDNAFVERFRREAQAAASLSHHNIVPVFDWGESEDTYFIVMEYVDGETLSSVIRNGAPLAPRRAAEIACDIAKALSYAHRHGVVHRDVKPGNVLLTSDGESKVTDFGIARAVSSLDQQLTQSGLVMGTAAYFSPEQAQGLDVDGRTDIYALGVVLFEMLTGRQPFVGETPVSIAYQHVQEEPPKPRALNPSIPLALEAIVLRAMAKLPAARYGDADDLRTDLELFLRDEPLLTTALGEFDVAAITAVIPLTTASHDTAPMRALPRESDHRSRSAWLLGGGIALLLALLVVAFFGARHFGYLGGSRELTVPNVSKLSENRAVSTLRADGLKPKVQVVPGVVGTAGRVISQSPAHPATVRKGSSVVLNVGGTPPQVAVPVVTGLFESVAQQQLGAMGFNVKVRLVKQTEASQIQGTVILEKPTAQAQVPKGTTVMISVVSGSALVTVPNWSKEPAAAAGVLLTTADLKLGSNSTGFSPTVPQGDVIRSSPASGTSIKRGTAVDLVISGGPGVQIPNLIGQNLQAAELELQGLGLGVAQGRSYGTPNSGLWGNVAQINCEASVNQAQYPDCAAGSSVGPGATITLRIGRPSAGSDTTTTTISTTTTTIASSTTPTPPVP